MNIEKVLDQKKTDILNAWIKQVLGTYSADGARIFSNERDRFANPVGHNVRAGLTEIYEALVADQTAPVTGEASFKLVQVRAVQEFSPSEALSFIFLLKELVRREAGAELDHAALERIDRAVDRMALQLFDHYMACRERLFRVRLEEIERNRFLVTDGGCPSRFLRNRGNTATPAGSADAGPDA